VPHHGQWRRSFLCRATLHAWRYKKGLFEWNFFTEGLFLKFVSSLGYFCLNFLVLMPVGLGWSAPQIAPIVEVGGVTRVRPCPRVGCQDNVSLSMEARGPGGGEVMDDAPCRWSREVPAEVRRWRCTGSTNSFATRGTGSWTNSSATLIGILWVHIYTILEILFG
jgi:hypothetical protein